MLISFLYEISLIIIAIAYLPKFLYDLMFKKKYRKSILKRLGSGFPIIKKGKRPLIWVHAVSLGETKAVAALVKQMRKEFKHPLIVFSTTTETGYVEACRGIVADHHVYLPFDFGWVINSIVKRISPDLVVLCESDFWFNFLRSAKKSGAITAVVNGKISEASAHRFKKFSAFAQALFSTIDIFCVQSNLYRKRFESLGIPAEKIIVTGNMKFDGDYAKLPNAQIEAWRNELGISPNDPVIVVGSSHNPEETLLLKSFAHVWAKFPKLKVLFVPRHPERFNEVAGLLQKHNINFRRLSNKSADKLFSVILIDAMGLLRKCYQLADIAIVAGSYTSKVGGHNILEPSYYGVPVVFGPYMHTQPELVELVNEYGAGLQVPIENLHETILELLGDGEKRIAIGKKGSKLVEEVHGATNKTMGHLKKQALEKSASSLLKA